ncbi:hypothetical protein EDEG_00638 [Edhazardia aedis USNM 41457]|uniref:Uncharacterized protein n=1 Tax=Edhazardia aedis (strain USNM 41457) TaxID=1003232 RepID=J9DVI7_EDHAE|nr:hypothetical protein EDEG_00638 [Edhazardia aedis USNM 41457]|eukprot:EJW05302.1 hypothetical protein EDEG_00638 [Edhazardia aedis USNM 41457]
MIDDKQLKRLKGECGEKLKNRKKDGNVIGIEENLENLESKEFRKNREIENLEDKKDKKIVDDLEVKKDREINGEIAESIKYSENKKIEVSKESTENKDDIKYLENITNTENKKVEECLKIIENVGNKECVLENAENRKEDDILDGKISEKEYLLKEFNNYQYKNSGVDSNNYEDLNNNKKNNIEDSNYINRDNINSNNINNINNIKDSDNINNSDKKINEDTTNNNLGKSNKNIKENTKVFNINLHKKYKKRATKIVIRKHEHIRTLKNFKSIFLKELFELKVKSIHNRVAFLQETFKLLSKNRKRALNISLKQKDVKKNISSFCTFSCVNCKFNKNFCISLCERRFNIAIKYGKNIFNRVENYCKHEHDKTQFLSQIDVAGALKSSKDDVVVVFCPIKGDFIEINANHKNEYLLKNQLFNKNLNLDYDNNNCTGENNINTDINNIDYNSIRNTKSVCAKSKIDGLNQYEIDMIKDMNSAENFHTFKRKKKKFFKERHYMQNTSSKIISNKNTSIFDRNKNLNSSSSSNNSNNSISNFPNNLFDTSNTQKYNGKETKTRRRRKPAKIIQTENEDSKSTEHSEDFIPLINKKKVAQKRCRKNKTSNSTSNENTNTNKTNNGILTELTFNPFPLNSTTPCIKPTSEPKLNTLIELKNIADMCKSKKTTTKYSKKCIKKPAKNYLTIKINPLVANIYFYRNGKKRAYGSANITFAARKCSISTNVLSTSINNSISKDGNGRGSGLSLSSANNAVVNNSVGKSSLRDALCKSWVPQSSVRKETLCGNNGFLVYDDIVCDDESFDYIL